MMTKTNKKNRIKNFLVSTTVLLFTVAAIAASLMVPGYLLEQHAAETIGITTAVPTPYYSGPSEAIVRNASRQLTEEQCVSLIYGDWESTISTADLRECSMSEYEIVSTYDYGIHSDYQKWYSWNAEPYKAVDTTFETYAAIFWKVTFTKYTGNEIKVFYITEGGTILDEKKIDFK